MRLLASLIPQWIPFSTQYSFSAIFWYIRRLNPKNDYSHHKSRILFWIKNISVITSFINTPMNTISLQNIHLGLYSYIWSLRHLENQNLSWNGWDNFFVPFLAAREAVAPLANNPIVSERSYTHLECQNPSIKSDSMDSARC